MMSLGRVCCLAVLLSGAFATAPVSACDESLLRILTADDPNGPFAQAITGFHKRLAELGVELKNRGGENHDKSLEGLMGAWLEFSNRYMANPPEQARGDPVWQKKMENAASRIGQIRTALRESRVHEAHDTVLLLSTEIATFFECFGLSPLKRLFLGIATCFEECERWRGKGEIALVEQAIGSLTLHLATLEPRLTSETRPLYERVMLEFQEMKKALHEPSAIAAASFLVHLETMRTDFQKLREKQLMFEWFSPGATTASSPPVTTASGSESR